MQVSTKKTTEDILDARKKVMELAQTVYALIEDETLAMGFVRDARDPAMILKRRRQML
jgi:hypothetical protein